MRNFLLVIAVFATTAIAGFAQMAAKVPEQNDNAEQAVLQVTNAWLDADERLDRAALDKIIASDFLGTAPGGRVVYKRDIMPEEGTSAGHGLSISMQDVKVRVFGGTAVVSGRGVPKAQAAAGSPVANTQAPSARPELRFTVVFVKRADRWQMVTAHLSPIATKSEE